MAVVEFAGLFGVEEQSGGVEDSGLPIGFAAGGVDEDVFGGGTFTEGEEVRALPHFSGVDGVWNGG